MTKFNASHVMHIAQQYKALLLQFYCCSLLYKLRMGKVGETVQMK